MGNLKDFILTDQLGRKYRIVPLDVDGPAPETITTAHAVAIVKSNQGLALREAREKIGISQEELAKLSGLTQAAISRIETGTAKARKKNYEKLINIVSSEKYKTI